ncbi:methyltransferase domain-containing protein [Streptomyces millisiae]|uniref:Protein-L-isoaspartate O-methyltransferase n=1 Tax=Streptomyces millisiae TaxID=3075542 RepID=A0ABU2LMR4_9ACTN|nr:methyltransferase domain-containing protein [Streptomyces sp. DSM 44918]MDT0318877.1 methyltransferase domain-containing protein [Streptomyces sp. DSM 44918]
MTTMRRLVAALRDAGSLPPRWEDAVAAVDRADFVPDVCPGLDRAADEAAWLAAVYSDRPVVTQVDEGVAGGRGIPTSSSSQPSQMLEMLELLDVHEGQRVLEIGTATGYHAAWLCHRLGSEHVTSVEIDRRLHEAARKNLAAAGYAPCLVLGDGTRGHPAGAPYDRIISTCTLREITPELLAQTRDGGRIVTPFGSSLHSYSYLTLDVHGGVGEGRFSGRPAFMWSRTQAGRGADLSDVYHGERGERGTTDLDPAQLNDPDAMFAISLRVRDAWPQIDWEDDGSGEWTYWLLSDDRRSWARTEFVPGRAEFTTEQHGPRRLWDEVAAAYRHWRALGAPGRSRHRLRVTPEGWSVDVAGGS